MKPQSNVVHRPWAAVAACCGIALALGPIAVHSRADEWNKRTVLTINQPLQVEDTYLEPGQYVFRLVDSSSDRHIVQIYNAQENHLIATIFAIPDFRVQPTGHSAFRMWETPAGYVAALRDWYYPGDNFGQQFTYPKNLKQIQVAQVTPPPAPTPAPEAAPAPEPQPQAEVQEQQQTTVVEEAQNTPPPAPPVAEQPEPAPAPTPAPAPQELPKTASHYPLIGFLGALLLGMGGLIRRACSA
jgi:LPXTG-motif cell wall-anchored protein